MKKIAVGLLLAMILVSAVPLVPVPALILQRGAATTEVSSSGVLQADPAPALKIEWKSIDQAHAWISEYIVDCCANGGYVPQGFCCWLLEWMIENNW